MTVSPPESVTLAEADQGLMLAATAHIYVAPVGTAFFNLDAWKFGDESSHTGWAWLGDTSAENLPSFEKEGGELEWKRSADRLNLKPKREANTYSGTIESVAVTKKFLEYTHQGGKWNSSTKSYTVTTDVVGREWTMMVVLADGLHVSGLGLYKVELLSGFPVPSLEEFQSMPVSVAIGSVDKKVYEIFEPRTQAA